jgi:hypothetical protein
LPNQAAELDLRDASMVVAIGESSAAKENTVNQRDLTY